MRTRLLVSVCLLVAACLVPLTANAVTQYTITDLGTLGGEARAYSINNLGQIAGRSETAGGNERAFLYADGAMVDLGTLGGSGAAANAINDWGQVVGTATTEEGTEHAFIWQSGNMTDLGTLGGYRSVAVDLNEVGQVTGQASGSLGVGSVACLWQDGVAYNLGVPGSISGADGINEHGEIVGFYNLANAFHAYLYTDGALQELGTLGGESSFAEDINDGRSIVGWAHNPDAVMRAFVWCDGQMIDLGALDGLVSAAHAINTRGEIVGYSTTGGEEHAVLWADGLLYDLNAHVLDESGWILRRAMDINDAGQIVGWGYHGSQVRAFLLTPIPEPSTLALVALGVVGMLLRKTRKH